MNPDIERRKDYIDLGWIKKGLMAGLFALITHFTAGIWWAATLTAKLDFVQESLLNLKIEMKDGMADRYTSRDATKDLITVNSRIDRNEVRLARLEGRP